LFRNNEPTGVRVNTRSGPGAIPFTGPEWWVAGLFLIAGLLLQSELVHYFTFRGAQLSIVLVVIVWYAVRADFLRAGIFGFLAGLCEDALGAQTGAAWTIASTFTALFTSMLSRWLFADSPPAAAAVVFIATLLRRMIFWIVMALQGYPPGYARLHFHQALWEALINAIFMIVAMLAARALEARGEERRGR
jgi:rod shape-determining protein MreD